ncbi:MAG: bifunctional riboflavin kinase/FAD synthetase [Bacteroidales bacterium]
MILVDSNTIDTRPGLVATVGFFDGVHLGHQHLISCLKCEADKLGLKSAVFTFREHPRKVVNSSYHPSLLNTFEEKVEHLTSTDIDYCVAMNFTPQLSRLTARDFMLQVLSEQYNVKVLYVGYDHRFGRDRVEEFEDYKAIGDEIGIEVKQAPVFKLDDRAISSSLIRRYLEEGSVDLATEALSYPYHLSGLVVEGFQIGRKINFPTANLLLENPDKLIPKNGVYVVRSKYKEESYFGMMNIGNRPTVHSEGGLSVEVNLFDFDQDIYGEWLNIEILTFLREEKKLKGLEELKGQLQRDKETSLDYIKRLHIH